MDSNLTKVVQDLCQEKGVKGVLCVGPHGLPYFYNGGLTDKSAAVASQLISLCSSMVADATPKVITVASSISKIILKKHNDSFTIGVYKSTKN